MEIHARRPTQNPTRPGASNLRMNFPTDELTSFLQQVAETIDALEVSSAFFPKNSPYYALHEKVQLLREQGYLPPRGKSP